MDQVKCLQRALHKVLIPASLELLQSFKQKIVENIFQFFVYIYLVETRLESGDKT